MIFIKEKKDCTGCNACGDICPQNAINFSTDEEGFWYPIINEAKCVNCGLCEKVCPISKKSRFSNFNSKEPNCFAAEHKSVDVIFSSTTGGMFSALADVMYSKNGYVGGAIHNCDFSVSHFISDNREDLQKLRRSKDLQSNAEGFYKKVKSLLEANKNVLVCGLPCQIAALYSYIDKSYETLVTVDLVCLGVNSPKVWRKYLDYIEEKNGSKIVYTENKSKEYGWHNLTQKFVFENGEEYFDTVKTSLFIKGYINSHLYCRPSCYDCRFKNFPRVGDLTIGDFWGIEKYSSKYNSDIGTSLVLVNSNKGSQFFDKAKKRINYESVDIKYAIAGNPALKQSISKISNQRDSFFKDLENIPFDSIIEKYSVRQDGIRSKIRKIKSKLNILKVIAKTTRLRPTALFQTIWYSGIKNLYNGKGIVFGTNCHLNIAKSSHLKFDNLLVFGKKGKFVHSNRESNLYIGENGTLEVLGRFDIESGSDIQIFDNASLIIHGSKLGCSDANSGLQIVCGNKIEIKPDVGIGRNVMIRDTNGNHFINTVGYRISRPIEIGEKAWLCESCTIMPGVKIGRGAIVGVNSTVIKNVPKNTLVSGFPAQIIQENVLWKC